MNVCKYLNLIILLFFFNIISNSSADEWKKLKRRLLALGLLHSIRVKTIIPLPLPVPLPVIIKKVNTPLVLPPKKVPFLVPKPVPVYQIIPKFVPVYKDSKSTTKLWSNNDNHLLSQPTTSHEEYLRPSFDTKLDYELIGKLANNYIEKPEFMSLGSMNDLNNLNNLNKLNLMRNHLKIPTSYVDQFEFKPSKKYFRNRKNKKQKLRKVHGFISYDNDDDEIQYEDLLMLSTQPKAKSEATNPYTDHRSADNKSSELSVRPEMRRKQISNALKTKEMTKEDLTSRVPTTRQSDRGMNTTIKKVKVGELRIRPNQLKQLLQTHKQGSHQ